MDFRDSGVSYEAFGAQGDGITDDMQAICEAHEYANAHGMSVKSKSDATYHLGGRALPREAGRRAAAQHGPCPAAKRRVQ